METFKPYIVEFNPDGIMKPKEYLFDYSMGGNNWWPIIVITHNKCTFSANNGIWQAWHAEGDLFLQPKSRDQDIIASNFLLSFGRLDLKSLSIEKREKILSDTGFTYSKVVEIFEYGKKQWKILGWSQTFQTDFCQSITYCQSPIS